ncbi:spermatogenesis-associated protein 31D1-like [Molossus molossus]|nr:spermatogenesis-associated protein 31D1-like [Molossus molossus]
MTPLGSFLSPSSPGQTLSPEPFPPLESKFPVHCSPPQPKDLLSSTSTQCDFHQEFSALHSTKTSFGGDTAAKLIDPRHLPFLSSDEHDSVQQSSYPKNWKDLLKQKFTQFFWGLPSLHSESLTSAVHVSGDYSSIIIFNSISNASTGQEYPALPYFLPASLPEGQPQSLPPTLPLTELQPQAHHQSPLPSLPSSPTPQFRVSGVYVHTPQNESECLTSSEIQHLKRNVLEKKQESLWDSPSVIQNPKKDSCPSAPTSPYCQSANVRVSISTDPAEFSVNSERQEKFEHHLRKGLIQQQQGLPDKVHESLSLMRPLSDCSGISKSKSSYGLSQVSVYKGQSSKNLHIGLSQPGSFYERASDLFQLEEDEGKDERERQGGDPKDHLLRDSESSSHKDVGNDTYMMSLSGENSMMSGQSVNQRQLESVLKGHPSKKFENIDKGRHTGTVHSSRHTIGQTPGKPHTETARSSGPAPVGGGCRLSTCQELSFLQSSAQQMLEAHITEFRTRMVQGLPPIVRKSIETFKLRDTSPPSLIVSKSSSSTNLVSEVSSESGGFTALRGNSKSPHVDREGPENSATILNLPLPATPLVDKEGQGTLTNSPSDIRQGLSEELQKILNAKKILLPVTNSTISKTSERHTPRPNIRPPKLPTVQAGTGHELKDKTVNASDRAEIPRGTNGEKSEPASMPTVKKTVRAEELDALRSKSSDLLTTSKPEISQKINVDENKGETTVTTEESPPKMSDSKLSDLQKQLIDELKSKLEKGNHSQAQGQPTDTHHDSDSLTCKASLSPAQDVSTVDTGAVQVLHVHLEDRGVSMEHRQEPWVPKNVLRICEDKRFPPAVKKVSPAGSRSEELGGGDAGLRSGGDAGLRPSQARRKRFPSQDTALEEMLGGKPPQTLPQKGQSPDSLFISKMKTFFQWLHPERKFTEQEHSQNKGRPISSAQSRGPVKSRTPFPGRMKVQRVRSDIGKFPEEKQRRRHAVDTTCPQEPLPSAVEFGKAQQKAAVGARAEPVQGHPFRSRTPSCKVTHTKSGRQAAIFAGQSSASSRQTRNKGRHPQKVVALKDQQLCQKHPQSVPRRGTVPRPSPTFRPQAAQGPPAALTTAEGTEFRDQSPRLRPKTLPQNFQGKKIPKVPTAK